MSAAGQARRTIIIKKAGGGHGHHGGAWKVAYADFVTAMMAFFMVMWLLASTDQRARKEIANYFRTGILPDGDLSMAGVADQPSIIEQSAEPPQTKARRRSRTAKRRSPGGDHGSWRKLAAALAELAKRRSRSRSPMTAC